MTWWRALWKPSRGLLARLGEPLTPVRLLGGPPLMTASTPRWLPGSPAVSTARPGRLKVGVDGEGAQSVVLEQPATFQPVTARAASTPVVTARGPVAPARRGAADPGVSGVVDRLRQALGLPLDRLLPGAGALLDWPAPMHPYQREGVEVLMTRPRVLLADDMGLGKTVQVIAALRLLLHQRSIETALIVVPAALADQWRREVDKWAPELRTLVVRGPDRAPLWHYPTHIKIVSYETLRSDLAAGVSPPHPLAQRWGAVVLDEAQRIKNRDADISHSVKRLARDRSWALTGTPLENQVDDLASILEFVDHRDDGSRQTYAPAPALLHRHRQLQLRRRKQDVLTQLPPKRIVEVRLDLLPQQRAAYDRAEREGVVHLRALGRDVRIEHVLALITRLKQICNIDPASGASAKLQDIRDRMTELIAEGHRALLFSQYTKPDYGVGAAARALSEFAPLTFTGGMAAVERERAVLLFRQQPEHGLLILSLKAGGVGLNLQEASYVFHLDRWWNPAVERQAEDRAHRLGQTVPVTVFKYICAGTIEERIERLLAQKQSLFDEIVDDVSLDLDVSARLTAEQLFGLFNLQPPAATAGPAAPGGSQSLGQRCARILGGRGWSVREAPRPEARATVLMAYRTDELGIEQRITLECWGDDQPVEVEAVRALVEAAPQAEPHAHILATGGAVTPEALRLASERGLHVWDGEALRRLEEAAPPQVAPPEAWRAGATGGGGWHDTPVPRQGLE